VAKEGVAFDVGLVVVVVVGVVAFLGGWAGAGSVVGIIGRVGTFLCMGGGIVVGCYGLWPYVAILGDPSLSFRNPFSP
jgi:uncharacterized Tic20 family protein